MRNRSADVPYCDVRADCIRAAHPVLHERHAALLAQWIMERYRIRIRKEVKKLPPPWTEDPVLASYRFCNVRREHDRESRWLIECIATSELSDRDKVLNCILFRLYNKSTTMAIIGPQRWETLDLARIRAQFAAHRAAHPGHVYFSNAFYTSGPKAMANRKFSDPDMCVKMVLLVDSYAKAGVVERVMAAKNQRAVYDAFRACDGLGAFLAYQIFVDCTYNPRFPFSENEFTIAGPGCEKGLALLFARTDALTPEELLFWLRDNPDALRAYGYNPAVFSDLPPEEQRLNVMSLENCMCELSKYVRALDGTGRPRVRYAASNWSKASEL